MKAPRKRRPLIGYAIVLYKQDCLLFPVTSEQQRIRIEKEWRSGEKRVSEISRLKAHPIEAARFVALNKGLAGERFITLCFNAATPPSQKQFEACREAIVRRLKRKFPQALFIMWAEFGKVNGMHHLHAIMYGEFEPCLLRKPRSSGNHYRTNRQDENWLSKNWCEVLADQELFVCSNAAAWEEVRRRGAVARYASKSDKPESWKKFHTVLYSCNQLKKLPKPDGVVFVSCPQAASLPLRRGRGKWKCYFTVQIGLSQRYFHFDGRKTPST